MQEGQNNENSHLEEERRLLFLSKRDWNLEESVLTRDLDLLRELLDETLRLRDFLL